MAHQEMVFRVFVASPSDVMDERNKLEEVIRDLNLAWSKRLGIRIELLRWETHAFPGIAEDPQQVINEQISDYDCLIVILWHRFGTETNRAGSGTMEEFERAKARYRADPDSMKLMVYFKDGPVPPSMIEGDQLSKITDFRRGLSDEGILYWSFNDLSEFEHNIRLHLSLQAQAWQGPATCIEDKAQRSLSLNPALIDDDEPGVLDLIDVFEDSAQTLNDVASRIVEESKALGSKLLTRTEEIEEFSRLRNPQTSRREARHLVARAAGDMNQYASRMNCEIPLFHDAFNAGIKAFIRAIEISKDPRSDDLTAGITEELLKSIVELRENLRETQQQTNEFRQAVAELPRITGDINKAKRGVVLVLDNLMTELNSGERLLGEAEASINSIVLP